MRELNESLFARLIECAPNYLRINVDVSVPRWIKTDDPEKEFIKYSTIRSSDLGGGRRGALVSNERLGKLWAVLPGQLDAPSLDDQIRGATVVNLHAGWLTVLGSEAWFSIRAEQLLREQIVELLGAREGEYSHEELLNFYDDYHIIDISGVPRDKDSAYLLSRIAAVSALAGKSYNLAFDGSAAQTLLEIVEGDVSSLFSASIYRSITASHWVHSYLELYRCIEYFYPVTYVAELARRVGLASQESLYDSLTEVLGWRPYEEDALARILSMIDEGSLQVLATTLGINPQEMVPESPLNRRVAKQVYKLRNAIAHHHIGLEESPGMDWSQLIRGLCSIVKELQRIYPDGKSPAAP